jgi:iron-sulfur cluster repair protein YtfE (RIC family)
MSHACSCNTHRDPSPSLAPVTPEQTLAELSQRSGALEVLQRLGINHCCGAHLSLREAAAAAGVSLDALLGALRELAGTPA